MALAISNRIDLKYKKNKTLSTEALAYAYSTIKRQFLMTTVEQQTHWLVSDPGQVGQWSPSGHKNGQLVSETAYLVTNV